MLAGIDLSLAPGTLTAVLGGSGSGKSTLGRLLAGWLRPGSGGILEGFLELAGTRLEFRSAPADPRIDPAAWCRQVGFVPQDAAAAMSTVRATVAEELAFGLENLGTDRPAMQAAVRRVASLTGLDHLLDRDPAGISGGELRRLAIGCAVITGPAVLVLDEPFASLDAAGDSGADRPAAEPRGRRHRRRGAEPGGGRAAARRRSLDAAEQRDGSTGRAARGTRRLAGT